MVFKQDQIITIIKKFLDQVSLQAILASNNMLTIANSDFTTLYNGMLENIVYNFTEADEKAMSKSQTNAESQIQAVLNSWEGGTGGKITDSQISSSDCFPATKLGYIDFMVQDKWQGDIDKIPSSLNSFKMAYQSYQVDAQVSFQLQSASAKAMLRLKACRKNSKEPTKANGGLQIESDEYHTAFGPFPTQNKINGDLKTLTNKANISMKLSNFNSKETHLSVNGSAGISIPLGNFFSIGIGASASYKLDTFTSSSSSLEIEMNYEGITFIGAPLTAGNLSTDNKKGWYDNDILSQTISNTENNTTGYRFVGNQYDTYFGPGKKFSRVKTWVISQQPTIKMKFCAADTSKITSVFKEKSSAKVKFLGLFTIGGVEQSYEVKKVDENSAEGCVTVEMGASKVIGTTTLEDSTAYVVGGVASYPPQNT